MISKKLYTGDGTTRRFLSDFTIKTYEFAKPYLWLYDNTLPIDGSGDHLINPGMPWSFPDNIWVRGQNAPKIEDLVGATHWEVLDNAVAFYYPPLARTNLWIEVATTLEEFGDTLVPPALEEIIELVDRAEDAADRAEDAADRAEDTLQDVIEEGDRQVDRVIEAGDIAVDAAWDSEAEALTSQSYAMESFGENVLDYEPDYTGGFIGLPTNDYSSFHWSMIAATVAQGMTYKGTWSPLSGAYPVGPNEAADFYVVSTTGDYDSISYIIGDYLVRNIANDGWDRFPNISDWSSIVNVPYNVLNAITATELQVETDRATGAEESLQAQLLAKSDIGHTHNEYFTINQHIDGSIGAGSANQPIKTNSVGKISLSLLGLGGFTYIGRFTPTPQKEYPDTNNYPYGSYWNLEANYTWTTGDLAGQYAEIGDLMVFGQDSWVIREVSFDPTDYYRLDGSKPISAHFAGGGFRLSNIGPSQADTDAPQRGEVLAGLAQKSDISHLHTYYIHENGGTMLGQLNTITPIEGTNATNKHYVDTLFNTHSHEIDDVLGLETALNTKLDKGNAFLKTEHTVNSVGGADAGKPIVLDSSGQLDPSLLGNNSLYPVGDFTPVAGIEYPDTTGEAYGAYWFISGVDDTLGYTFTGGDLAGETVENGDVMIWAAAGWLLIRIDISPENYYHLSGTNAITAPFSGGGQQFKNAAPATEAGDLVEYSQIAGLTTDFLRIDGTLAMAGRLDMGLNKIENLQEGILDSDATTYGQVLAGLQTRLGKTEQAADSVLLGGLEATALPISTATQLEIDTKADQGHSHAISEVSGLQSALDSKPTGTWTFDGDTLAITIG